MKTTLLLFMIIIIVFCQEDGNLNTLQDAPLLFDEDDMNLENLVSNDIIPGNENNSEEDIPGYINMNAGLPMNKNLKASNSFRFSQQKPKDNNPSLQPWFYNTKNPPKHSEVIRKEALSNGVVLEKGKRTLNFESGKYPLYFMDLRRK